MKKFLKEFKEFAMRGNVLDMAIGVIIATAFGKITTALINDVLMPAISWMVGARDMTALNIVVRDAVIGADGEVIKEAITLGFGTLISTVVDFILVALVVFIIIKTINKTHEKFGKKEEEAAAAPTTKICPFCKSEISIEATRCPHCTSKLDEE